MSTREKIIFESLRLFSEKGYNGVSMREIASAVGIKGASIYNHFKSKETIFEEIFQVVSTRFDSYASAINIPVKSEQDAVELYLNISEEQLLQIAEALFMFMTRDEYIVMFRKLLISEQNNSALAAKYLKEYYIEAPVKYQTEIFKGIQKQGGFKGFDPEIMALHFYSPIYYILIQNDLDHSNEKHLEMIKKHVHTFYKLYIR